MTLTTKLTTYTTALVLACALFLGSVQPAAAYTASQASQLASVLSSLQTLLDALKPEGEVLGATSVTVSTQQELADAIVGANDGDIIKLQAGSYGKINIDGNRVQVGSKSASGVKTHSNHVTIVSANTNNRAVVEEIETRNAPYWKFDSLSIRPSAGRDAVVVSSAHTIITKNDITFGDASGWSVSDWANTVADGILLGSSADYSEISYNNLKNVDFGISVGFGADHVKVKSNIIDNFAGDGLRGLGDYGLFENNMVTNCIDMNNGNHDDGFQSWVDFGTSEPNYGGVLRYNSIITSTRPDPLRCTMQGIGMFDGPYVDWTIENNLVIVDHWHGIAVYGSEDSVIRQNLVADADYGSPGPSWVVFSDHKDGTPTKNGTLTQNYATDVSNNGSAGVTASGNVEFDEADYDTYFVDYRNDNWSPKPGAFPFSVGANPSGAAPEPDPESESPQEEEPVEEEEEVEEEEPAEEVVEEEPVTEETTPDSILSASNIIADSGTFATDHEPVNLFDGCTSTTQGCSTGTDKSGSFWVEFDLGQLYDLSSAKIYGDTNGTWHSRTWTLETKEEANDSYQNAFENSSIYGNQWYNKSLNDTARYVKLTVTGTNGSNKVQAMEFALLGTKSNTTVTEEETTSEEEPAEEEGEVTEEEPAAEEETTSEEPTNTETTTDTRVRTTSNLNVRSTPNGTKVGSQNRGSLGTIKNQARTTTSGYNWVYVDFDVSPDGYVADSFLSEVSSTQSNVDREAIMQLIQQLMQQLLAIQALYNQLYGS